MAKTTQNYCKQILERDSEFLATSGWMDYSLLLVKVNWGAYCNDNNSAEEDIIDELFSNPINAIPSTNEKGVYYQMAIIDYLQDWNNSKAVENFAKKIKNLDINADISAFRPPDYSKRFIREIANGIFGL